MSDEFGCTGCIDPDCEWCEAEALDLPPYISLLDMEDQSDE